MLSHDPPCLLLRMPLTTLSASRLSCHHHWPQASTPGLTDSPHPFSYPQRDVHLRPLYQQYKAFYLNNSFPSTSPVVVVSFLISCYHIHPYNILLQLCKHTGSKIKKPLTKIYPPLTLGITGKKKKNTGITINF